MMEKVAWYLLDNAQALSIVVYLLATIILMGLALGRGYLVIGKTYDNLEKAYDVLVKAQEQGTTQLTDQRISNAAMSESLKYLTAEIQRLNLELAECRGRKGQP